MTSDAPTLVPENALTTDPKCLWTPSHPENTHMEKFRQLMQSKHQDEKLGMNLSTHILDQIIPANQPV